MKKKVISKTVINSFVYSYLHNQCIQPTHRRFDGYHSWPILGIKEKGYMKISVCQSSDKKFIIFLIFGLIAILIRVQTGLEELTPL